MVFHHVLYGGEGLLPGLGDDDALAQRQTVGLDDGGDGSGFQILQCLAHIVEYLVFGGGDAVFLHQVLGEDLAALDDGGVGVGSEAGDTLFVQCIHTAQHQRIVGSHHGVVNGVLHSEGDDFVNFRSADGHAGSVLRDAAVAGEGEDFRDLGVLFQGADDGVFPSATAYNQ